MQALIIGGYESLVRGTFKRKLERYGITILKHDSYHSSYTGIPMGCEGVILIRDMLNHSFSEKVVLDAKAAHLPYATVERKWAKAEGILRLQGFIKDPTTTIAAVETVSVAPGTPYYEKAMKEYTDMVTVVDPEEAKREMFSSVALVLAEDYDLITLPEVLQNRVRLTFPDLPVTAAGVAEAVYNIRLGWSLLPNTRQEAMHKWVVGRFKRFQAGDESAWVHTRDNDAQSIFGVLICSDSIGKARAEVFGSWSKSLITTGGSVFFRSICPKKAIPAFHAEIKAGRMKGFRLPLQGKSKGQYRYLTSEQAIQDYVDQYVNQPISQPVETPQEKTEVIQKEDSSNLDSSNIVSMAELIESGVGMKISALQGVLVNQVGALTNFLGSQVKELSDQSIKQQTGLAEMRLENQELRKTLQQVADAFTQTSQVLQNVQQAIAGLITNVAGLTADVAALVVPVSAPAQSNDKASHLGHALLNAKDVQITMSLGNTP